MPETSVIDRAALDRLSAILGNDPAVLAEMMSAYFEDAPAYIAQLHSALERARPDELQTAAHSLKSNSASFGALALAEQCRALEMLGKAGSCEGAAECIAVIEKEYARAKEELEAIRASA